MAIKIISGGQTGVDRTALDAALEMNVPCGGWCPAERLAEDGRIASHYPLTELADADYALRTEQNVIDSDGTVIIYFGKLFAGTKHTLDCCQKHRKPYLLLDEEHVNIEQAANSIQAFVNTHTISTLNVAGPRASDACRAYRYTLRIMNAFLQSA